MIGNGKPQTILDGHPVIYDDRALQPASEYAAKWEAGQPATMGGLEISPEVLAECAQCPNCGILCRKELIVNGDCFRCRPRGRKAQSESEPKQLVAPALVVVAMLLSLGIIAGVVLAIAMR